MADASRRTYRNQKLGPYVLRERIGFGGMAETILAVGAPEAPEVTRGREVVLKRLLPHLRFDRRAVEMLREEAELSQYLRHPNIVSVLDHGESDEGGYLIMEHVRGADLQHALAECARLGRIFRTDIALHVMRDTLRALAHAHVAKTEQGVPLHLVHRDVAPDNILIAFDGRVKLADFGVAHASTREPTETGVLKGKLSYLAPEQVLGHSIDARTDVFACGSVFYELITGRRLFRAETELGVLEKIRDVAIDYGPRELRPSISEEIEQIMLRALARLPSERFQNAASMLEAIEGALKKFSASNQRNALSRLMTTLFKSSESTDVEAPPLPAVDDVRPTTVEAIGEASGEAGSAVSDDTIDESQVELPTQHPLPRAISSVGEARVSEEWLSSAPEITSQKALVAPVRDEMGEGDTTGAPSVSLSLESVAADFSSAPLIRIPPPLNLPQHEASHLDELVVDAPPPPKAPPATRSHVPARSLSPIPVKQSSQWPLVFVFGGALLVAVGILLLQRETVDRARAWIGLPANGGRSSIEIRCNDPVSARVEPGGLAYSQIRALIVDLPPGEYHVALVLPDGRRQVKAVRLGGGELARVECAE